MTEKQCKPAGELSTVIISEAIDVDRQLGKGNYRAVVLKGRYIKEDISGKLLQPVIEQRIGVTALPCWSKFLFAQRIEIIICWSSRNEEATKIIWIHLLCKAVAFSFKVHNTICICLLKVRKFEKLLIIRHAAK